MNLGNQIKIIGLFICVGIGLYILYYVEHKTQIENMSLTSESGGNGGYNTDSVTRIVAVPNENGLSEKTFGKADHSNIPKTIWTFWSDGQSPSTTDFGEVWSGPDNELVQQCIQSWKHHNPDYTVVVLTKQNYKKYVYENIDVDEVKHSGDFVARYADYIRCLILSQHGGFWIDASVICHAPLSWVHATQNETGAELVGYYIHTGTYPEYMKTSPMIENWFFACVPGSLFMQDWCEEFFRTDEYQTIAEYLDNVKQQGTNFNNIHNLASPEYLTMHIAAQKVMQQPTDGHKYNLYLYSACAGPFAYLYETDWNTAKSVNQLVDKSSYESYYQYPLIKLRGSERTALEQYESSVSQRVFSKN